MKRKLLSIAAALCFIAGAKAQTSYGIKAGLNFPKYTFSGDGGSISSDASTSFYVTGFVDAPIANNFSIQPGLSLQGKGGKSQGEKTDLMYLEIPVNFVYYVPAGSGNLFLGAGPYAGYALSGKAKANGVSVDIEFGDNGMKRFDAGLNFLGGYKLSNGFLINGGYGLGLVDLAGLDGASLKNRVFSVGVGYQF
ncbi:porin family protein [Sphingobacterium detergens]|uniref:Outer membrane protein with beta-barrel domain n=1 Tax=Sphingobacterium detergens TaxID=1145106 RepID=A0A420AE13_SPHD1|nr:porin family protein [Sphingobacterium detergens]RKE42685.1 outer membrane protein with beta-barrel domain [Sphingobacterium detergens]